MGIFSTVFHEQRIRQEVFDRDITKVVYLKVSDKEALWRLSGRDDERLDTTLKSNKKKNKSFPPAYRTGFGFL